MYLTYPLLPERLHSDRLAGLFTLFHVPHMRPQPNVLLNYADSVAQIFPFVKMIKTHFNSV